VTVDTAAGDVAQLAELILSVSRRLGLRDHQDAFAVPLSPLEAMVMRHVDAEPGTTPSRISAKLGLRSSNTSAALRDLEAKGFVRRTVDPADARSVRVEPTPLASENLARKREHWVRLLAPHLPDAGAVASAVAVLAGLDSALEGGQHRPEPGE
jgi:DNA-binding MarR family transcriptional regulator